jgi:hypothetical protein
VAHQEMHAVCGKRRLCCLESPSRCNWRGMKRSRYQQVPRWAPCLRHPQGFPWLQSRGYVRDALHALKPTRFRARNTRLPRPKRLAVVERLTGEK